MTRLLTAVLLTVVIATSVGCSGADVDPRVGFEAQWQCDVQRQTFDDLEDIELARSDTLARWGISNDEYQAFRTQLNESPDLRIAVEAQYDEYCAN